MATNLLIICVSLNPHPVVLCPSHESPTVSYGDDYPGSKQNNTVPLFPELPPSLCLFWPSFSVPFSKVYSVWPVSGNPGILGEEEDTEL